ncbi:hypothetical protein [Pseudanabaena sp. FACHB-2040]|uniref:hypothetical protein n=1 Tax=Pseudanabaena sp. FACHB-2040 TaxID=2692859 RepID=UPI001684831F|nr:hypothetical protein [Pseudanabaena sp. FACHB-2040]MBD2261026.1 hypothetical protein [Pseudanabaena sp. FACHB-2040]
MEEAYPEEQLLSDDLAQESILPTTQKAQGLVSVLLGIQEDATVSSRTWNLQPNPFVFYGANQTPFGQIENAKVTIMTYQSDGLLKGQGVFTYATRSLGWSIRDKTTKVSLLDGNKQVLHTAAIVSYVQVTCLDDGTGPITVRFDFPANLFDKVEHVNVRYGRATWDKCS